jgi:CspA family cold shock protein
VPPEECEFMATGMVKWFSDAKGYGFITPDERGPDLFVHFTGIADGGFRTLTEGSRVEFEVRAGKKGMEAFNVLPLARPVHPGPAREGTPRIAKKRSVLRGTPRSLS